MNIDLLQGDSAVILKQGPSESVHLVVTSPPYDGLREYGGLEWDFEEIARELVRVLRPGGTIVWIVADQTHNGSESGSSFRQALFFMSLGLRLHDTMIWLKGTSPFQHKNRYINAFEYMFVFSKDAPAAANLIQDRKNKWAGVAVHGTERQVDGGVKPLSDVQKSKVIKEYGARLNVWDITPVKTNDSPHPAVYPEQLAIDHIQTWSNPGDLVLDPFLGSGTTGRAAVKLGRDFVGIERNAEYFAYAKKTIEAAQKEAA
jgi:DNA modification methylase